MATSQVSFRERQPTYGTSSSKARIGEGQPELRDWEIASKSSNDRGWPLRNSFQMGRAGKVADAYGEEHATSSSPRDDDDQVMARKEDDAAEKQGAEQRGSLKRTVEFETDLVANINSDCDAQDRDDGDSVLPLTGDGGGTSKQSVERIRALEKAIISPTTPRQTPLLQRVLQLEHKMTVLEERYNPKALATQLHEQVLPSSVVASPNTPSSLEQRCLSARSALAETQVKGTLVERIEKLETRLDEHIGTLQKVFSNGWFTRFDPNRLELDHHPQEAAKLLGWKSSNGDHQDHHDMPANVGVVERNHQGESGEPMERHVPTNDSCEDNKNGEQVTYNPITELADSVETSNTAGVPQKMKSLDKQPLKTSTPESVKEPARTGADRQTPDREKEELWQAISAPGDIGDKSPLAKKDKKKFSKLSRMSFKNVRDKFQRTFTSKQPARYR